MFRFIFFYFTSWRIVLYIFNLLLTLFLFVYHNRIYKLLLSFKFFFQPIHHVPIALA
jgi:hypothetical protein